MNHQIIIPVLDKVPELAASYLTKRDAKRFFLYLGKVFEIYAKKEKRTKHWLICSKYNYEWYTRFYVTLGDLIGEQVDLKKIPEYVSIPVKYGYFFQRRYVSKHNPIFNELMELSKRKGASVVEFNRMYYILKNYIASDFITEQYPSWYTPKSNVLWEGRDFETMCRVRLEKNNMLGITMKIETTYNNWDTVQITDPQLVKVIRALLKRYI